MLRGSAWGASRGARGGGACTPARHPCPCPGRSVLSRSPEPGLAPRFPDSAAGAGQALGGRARARSSRAGTCHVASQPPLSSAWNKGAWLCVCARVCARVLPWARSCQGRPCSARRLQEALAPPLSLPSPRSGATRGTSSPQPWRRAASAGPEAPAAAGCGLGWDGPMAAGPCSAATGKRPPLPPPLPMCHQRQLERQQLFLGCLASRAPPGSRSSSGPAQPSRAVGAPRESSRPEPGPRGRPDGGGGARAPCGGGSAAQDVRPSPRCPHLRPRSCAQPGPSARLPREWAARSGRKHVRPCVRAGRVPGEALASR